MTGETVASRYGPDQARSTICVYLEREGVALAPVSLELLTKGNDLARETGWDLTAMLLAGKGDDLAQEAIAHGADRVLLAEHRLLDPFSIGAHAQAAYQLLLKDKPSVFLLGATPNGRDLAGRLAVRLRTGLNADCTTLRLDRDRGVLVSEVSGFGGGVLALIEMARHRPQMATVRPGVFLVGTPDRRRTGRIIRTEVSLAQEDIRTTVVERVTGQEIELAQVPLLVVGGRGVDGNFDMLEELAGLLDGAVGATRPPVDDGYVGRQRQIGQTGVICRPQIVINCGISGAFQYLVGVQEAGLIISINTDPEAPIFEESDYCVVGDVHQVVPALITALKSREALSAEAGKVAHA